MGKVRDRRLLEVAAIIETVIRECETAGIEFMSLLPPGPHGDYMALPSGKVVLRAWRSEPFTNEARWDEIQFQPVGWPRGGSISFFYVGDSQTKIWTATLYFNHLTTRIFIPDYFLDDAITGRRGEIREQFLAMLKRES